MYSMDVPIRKRFSCFIFVSLERLASFENSKSHFVFSCAFSIDFVYCIVLMKFKFLAQREFLVLLDEYSK